MIDDCPASVSYSIRYTSTALYPQSQILPKRTTYSHLEQFYIRSALGIGCIVISLAERLGTYYVNMSFQILTPSLLMSGR